ncbi:MAG: HEAT repeat domain-containing protein [Deltaproteobacteria bacterium]|jgi:tetratricopeptide (TPR) repeat protein|nr:HEAT repeat domain-containing protein [Deltaproteobacteria bacterium]MBW2536366.1 HEAT repeat domain-containing protein [Deltaproteobacteria bacterium]
MTPPTTTPLKTLQQQARAARQGGNLQQAVALLYEAAQKTSAREPDYLGAVGDLRGLLVEQRRYRAALTIDWYVGDGRRQNELLAHVPLPDQARTLQAWGERADDGSQQRAYFAKAADLYEQAGMVAHSAIARERALDFGTARSLWSRLAQLLTGQSGDRYAAGLAHFNLARTCYEVGDPAAAHAAVVTSVHLLEEAADRYERIGQRERAFDCYQVLIAIGRQSEQFEHVLEGYVNVVRILREDHLRYYALQSHEEAIEAAGAAGEHSAGATLAQEMAGYAEAQGMPSVANHAIRLSAEMWQQVAQAAMERGAPAELAENALLAAVVAQARQGQFVQVGRLYATLAQLGLDQARRSHYARASRRYEGVSDQSVDATPLPSHLRQDTAYPEVWHVDLIEWEQGGSASAACGDIVLEADSWSEITRRRALLARLTALDVDAAGDRRAPDAKLVHLSDLLGRVELYTILSPLERLYETGSPEVRLAVIRAIERLMYKRTFVTVRKALSDAEAPVRQQACRTVEALRFPHAFDPLGRIYREHEDDTARAASLRAIARIDTAEAAELLLGVFQHEGQAERRAAADALKKARGTMFLEVARGALGTLTDDARASIREVFHARGETI